MFTVSAPMSLCSSYLRANMLPNTRQIVTPPGMPRRDLLLYPTNKTHHFSDSVAVIDVETSGDASVESFGISVAGFAGGPLGGPAGPLPGGP